MAIVKTDGVLLVHRFPLEGSGEIHAYFQHHGGEIKAHLRLVRTREDGSVSFTPKGITVPPSALTNLLKATALLLAEKETLGA